MPPHTPPSKPTHTATSAQNSHTGKNYNRSRSYDEGTIRVRSTKVSAKATTRDDLWRSKTQESIEADSPELESSPKDLPETDSVTLCVKEESVKQLHTTIKDKTLHFEKLKLEITAKQKRIFEVFTDLKVMQRTLESLGAEDVKVEVPKLEDVPIACPVKGAAPKELSRLPPGLVNCCDAAIRSHREIVKWLGDLLNSSEQGISVQTLAEKVSQFSKEYFNVSTMADEAKLQFMKEISVVANLFKSGGEEREKLQRETERLSVQVSELSTQNSELLKKLLAAEHPNILRADKIKIETLEEQLNEERDERSTIKGKLLTTEAALKSARDKITELERREQERNNENSSIQENLEEHKIKLQLMYEEEVKTVKAQASKIEELTMKINKLKEEKQKLEQSLEQYDENYETIASVRKELNDTIDQFKEVEAQKKQLEENYDKIKQQVQMQTAKLNNQTDANKKILEKLQKMENDSEEKNQVIAKYKDGIDDLLKKIEKLNEKIKESEQTNNLIVNQNKCYQELQESLTQELNIKEKNIQDIKNDLVNELRAKNSAIDDLKKKIYELEGNLRHRISKTDEFTCLVQSLANSLGLEVTPNENDFLEHFKVIAQMIKKEKVRMEDLMNQNNSLIYELNGKDKMLEEFNAKINETQTELERFQEAVSILSGREYKLQNALAVAENELEMGRKAHVLMNQKLYQKSEEIELLQKNIEKRKLEINNLEKIILALENQAFKMRVTKKNQQERILELENKILNTNGAKRKTAVPEEYLDYFIKILEAELLDSDLEETSKDKKRALIKRFESKNEKPYHREHQYEHTQGDFVIKDNSSNSLIEKGCETRDEISCDFEGGARNNINVYQTLQADYGIHTAVSTAHSSHSRQRSIRYSSQDQQSTSESIPTSPQSPAWNALDFELRTPTKYLRNQ